MSWLPSGSASYYVEVVLRDGLPAQENEIRSNETPRETLVTCLTCGRDVPPDEVECPSCGGPVLVMPDSSKVAAHSVSKRPAVKVSKTTQRVGKAIGVVILLVPVLLILASIYFVGGWTLSLIWPDQPAQTTVARPTVKSATGSA